MMILNSVRIALREIRRNILRSALTILGIVIGVAAVITLVTIGRGATAQVRNAIESMGSNLLYVRTGQRFYGGVRSAAAPFDRRDVEAIVRDIPNILAVAPVASKGTVAIFGNENWNTTVTGTDNSYFTALDWAFSEGRRFEDVEVRAGRLVCILGSTVRKELFGALSPLGETIRLGKLSCKVVGLLESKGQTTFGSDRDDIILIPLKAFQRRISGDTDINMIYVAAQNSDSILAVRRDIESLLRQRRGGALNQADDFNVRDMQEIGETLAGTTKILTALLGAVAAVSLLVGGIGIMNIMLVSVTERTREIGIRLAVGAMERDVLRQFLVEATVLSSLGGVIGILLGLGTAVVTVRVLKAPFIFDGGIIVIAFLFSAAVGIFFGYFPARKAARLNPIDALRHE